MNNKGKKNILWVDDAVNRPALLPDRDELEFKGFDVIPVENVDDFLNFIETETRSIDCAIIDIYMPPKSLDIHETQNGTRTGLVLCEKLKKSRYKDVKTMVYSVNEEEDISDFCKKNEIKYLTKSIKSSEFANEIENFIYGQ